MGHKTRSEILDEITAELMLADPEQPDTFDSVAQLFNDLAASGDSNDPGAVQARAALDALELADSAGARASVLGALERAVQALQGAAVDEPVDGKLVLPEWVDGDVFSEFLSAQAVALDDLETNLVALSRGEVELDELRRTVHTLKGEAGVVGLTDLQSVYHAIEDLLDRPSDPAALDAMFAGKDWVRGAFDAYAGFEHPEQSAEQILAKLRAAAAPQPPDAEPEARQDEHDEDAYVDDNGGELEAQTPSPEADAPTPGSLVRDADTIDLFSEFWQETVDGLAAVDETLMQAEQDGLDLDKVNGLFRVFHTIKGISSFLDELAQITVLAHTTETLLNRLREGEMHLAERSFDLLFDATSAMRRLLDEARRAIDDNDAVAPDEHVDDLLRRLRQLITLDASDDGALAQAPSGSTPEPTFEPTPEPTLEAAPQPTSEPDAAPPPLGPAQAEQAPAPRSAAAADGRARIKETIKVDVERIDHLVEMIGELVIAESMVSNLPEVQTARSLEARGKLSQLTKITRDLQDAGMRMRMVPMRGVFGRMARLVRDLSRKTGKQVRFTQDGEWTEMDRRMVERIADPLVHMIRNSMDHGIEPAPLRLAVGKAPIASIHLSAYQQGSSIIIEVSDDGRGLDRDAILAKARSKGLVAPNEQLTDAEVFDLIFAPGFSTAKQVTEVSGRGVGMDVVRRNVEKMRGVVLVSSKGGRGTTFKLTLPLTMAIIEGMLVACGDERYLIPTLSIIESIQPTREMLTTFANRGEAILIRDELLPLIRLDQLLSIPSAQPDPTRGLVVVIESSGRRRALLVDEALAQQQVVIKSLGHGIGATEFVSGAAILSDGNVGLILNVEELGYASSSNTPGTMHRRTRRAGAGAAPVPAGPQADAAGVNV